MHRAHKHGCVPTIFTHSWSPGNSVSDKSVHWVCRAQFLCTAAPTRLAVSPTVTQTPRWSRARQASRRREPSGKGSSVMWTKLTWRKLALVRWTGTRHPRCSLSFAAGPAAVLALPAVQLNHCNAQQHLLVLWCQRRQGRPQKS